MLDGLEATEVSRCQLNQEFRVEAEYYQKRYLREDLHRSKFHNLPLGALAFITDGQHGYHEIDETSPLSLLTAKNAKNWFADKIDADRVAQWLDDKNKRSSLQIKDLILSTRGSVGYCAIVNKDVLPANIDQDVARIAVSSSEIRPEFLLAYLNCTIGQDWMKRNATGMVQQGLSLARVREMPVPLLSADFQSCIEAVVKTAHRQLEQSKALYADAESLLLAELGLRDWQPSPENIAVKSFSESFGNTGRLDAEFYQPKYDYAREKLRALNPLEIVPFESLLTTLTNGHTPLRHDLSTGEITFLTAEHIYDFRINFDSDKRILAKHHENELERTKIKIGDLLLTIKGRIGNAAVVEDVPHPANINQDVALLRLANNLNAYYIAGYLNSILGKAFIAQICTGQINPFLGLGNLRTIPVPLFAPERMNELGASLKTTIHYAQSTAQTSQNLLECAKRGVELAIEQNEAVALAWLAAAGGAK